MNIDSDIEASFPIGLPFYVKMDAANKEVNVYSGSFKLRNEGVEIICDGSVDFYWLPTSGCHFKGAATNLTHEQLQLLRSDKNILIINEEDVGEVIILSSEINVNPKFSGVFRHKCLLGDVSIPVNSVRFSLPNFKEYNGSTIRYDIPGQTTFSNGRIILDDIENNIIIDKRHGFDEYQKQLKSSGGYMLTYTGQITPKSGSITYKKSSNVVEALQFFLTFINGNKTAPLFVEGKSDDNILWKDYKDAATQQYIHGISWTDFRAAKDYGGIWRKFYALWANPSDQDFLKKVIHWYTEANYAPVFSESKIILVQTGLELVYNWFLIEQQRLIIGNDVQSLSAVNKIRLVIHQLKIYFPIPAGLTELAQIYSDGPEAFVQIRNAIVHGNLEKRKKLNKLSAIAIFQAHQLGLWYLELSILFILGYDGNYFNRTIGRGLNPLETVPWKAQ